MSNSSNDGSTVSSKKDEPVRESAKKRKADSEEKDKSISKDKSKEKEKEKSTKDEIKKDEIKKDDSKKDDSKKDGSKKDESSRRVKESYDETKNSDDENDKGTKDKNGDKTSPFDNGLEPDKIIGATDINGSLAFLVQWKNSNKAMLIPNKLARQRCPQLVIDFYEQRLAWHNE